jgi:uncharacterized protein (DUF305 family)
MTVVGDETDELEVEPSAQPRSRARLVLVVICVVVGLLAAGAVGWVLHGGSDSVAADSVDAGFSRDMSTHHDQAVTMASYTRDHSDNPLIKSIAYDIESTQQFEVGRMSGWLDAWGLQRVDASQNPMEWMGHAHLESDGLMPGMATPEQMKQLQSSTGTELDILFLQLMIHHHQGGLPMAQYAAQHAKNDYVRKAAGAMATNQSNEIIQMGQLLAQLGGKELPPPQ